METISPQHFAFIFKHGNLFEIQKIIKKKKISVYLRLSINEVFQALYKLLKKKKLFTLDF